MLCFFVHYQSLWTVFDALSSNIDKVPLINFSSYVFVFGNFQRPSQRLSNLLEKFIDLVNSFITLSISKIFPDNNWQSCSFRFICNLQPYYLSCNSTPFIGEFWSCCCPSFHWFSLKLKGKYPFHRIDFDYSHANYHDFCDETPHGRISLHSEFLRLLEL